MGVLQTVKAVRVAPRAGLTVETLPAPSAITALYHRQASLDPTWCDRRVEHDMQDRLRVSHTLSLGSAPMLSIAWEAEAEWYQRGYRVELFLNNVGFPSLSNLTPIEQLNHGRLVGEAYRNEQSTMSLIEGSSFVTLMLISKKPVGVIGQAIARQRQKWTGSPVKVAALVRFAVDVPSLELATNRIVQQTLYNESLAKNIAARVQLASASGELDVAWHSARVESDVRRQTEELLATFRGTEAAFADALRRIDKDESMTPAAKICARSVIERLRVETLRLRQIPIGHDAATSQREATEPAADDAGDSDVG